MSHLATVHESHVLSLFKSKLCALTLLIAMPLLVVAMPFVTSNVLAPSSNALASLFLVVRPGAPSSVLIDPRSLPKALHHAPANMDSHPAACRPFSYDRHSAVSGMSDTKERRWPVITRPSYSSNNSRQRERERHTHKLIIIEHSELWLRIEKNSTLHSMFPAL